MTSSSFPIEPGRPLVADASVVINLNATGRAIEIIRALPHKFLVTDQVLGELMDGGHKRHDDGKRLQQLIEQGTVGAARLGEIGSEIYSSLVEGMTRDTLDDGEAATLAYALEVGGGALIDEAKARRICGARFSELAVASTVDVLLHEKILEALGARAQIEAVENALRVARMHVLPNQRDTVLALIGDEAAASHAGLRDRARY